MNKLLPADCSRQLNVTGGRVPDPLQVELKSLIYMDVV